MYRFFITLLAIFFLSIPAFPALAEHGFEGQILRVVVNDNSPPFSQRQADGTLTGFNVDFALEICKFLHAICKIETRPLKSAIDSVINGQFDMGFSNLLWSPERERRLLLSIPYWRSSTSLIGRRGMPDINLSEAVHDHHIAVLRGSRQFEVLSTFDGSSNSLIPFDTYADLWQCLRDNCADLGIMATLNALHFLLTEDGESFETIGNPLTTNGLGGSIHIDFPRNRPNLKDAVDAAIAHLRDDGTYQSLNRRYFSFDIY